MEKNIILKKTGKVLLAVLFIATVLSCAAMPVSAHEDDTLLVMYVLGTNLESETNTQATENIRDLINNWDRSSGEVLVFYGAADLPGWDQGTAVADYEQLIEDLADGRIGINAEDWTETPHILDRLSQSTGTKSALTEAIEYTNRYADENGLSDAHRYILLWDHGGAEDGIGHKDYGSLSNEDIGEALAASDKTFDAIIYDACLMANLEAAYEIKDRASYLLASEDSVPGDGLNYNSIAQALSSYTSKAPEDIANIIIDGYLADQYNGKTYSLIDLSKIDAIVSTLDSLGLILLRSLNDLNTIEVINQGYLDTDRFPSAERPNTARKMDLYDFASQLYYFGNGALRDTAEKLMTTADAAVLINKMTTGDPTKTNGLSISGSVTYPPEYIDRTVTLSNGDWAEFLKEFSELLTEDQDTSYSYSAPSEDDMADEITKYKSTINSKLSSPGTLTIAGDNGESIVFVDYLYRTDGKYYILSQEVAEAGTKEVEGNEFWSVLPTGEYTTGEDWDCTAFILNHANSSVPVTMLHTNEYTDGGETITEFTIDGILTRTVDGVDVSLPSYLTAVINCDTDTVLDVYVISGSPDDTYSRRSNAWGTEDILEGDKFTPRLDYMTEDSDEIASELSTKTFVFSDNPLADFKKVDLDEDNCFWEYEITTYSNGNNSQPTLLNPTDFVNGTVTIPATPTASAQSPAPFVVLAAGLAAAAIVSRKFN